jgi:hypothetical protein
MVFLVKYENRISIGRRRWAPKTCERVGLEEELAARYLSGTAGRKIKSGSGTWTR